MQTCARRDTEQQVLQIIASQFLAALIMGFSNSATIQPVAALERPVFYRERAAGEMRFTVDVESGHRGHMMLCNWHYTADALLRLDRPVQ